LGSTSICIAIHFQKVLSSFLAASGGKLNISKCRIYGWHVPGHLKDQISRIFGFPIITTWNYFKYLGMPIFLSTYGSSAWQEVIGKILARIQNWGGHWLNPAGKSVLIKSVLSSLSIFQCSGLLAPKGVLDKISRALRSFLWAGGKTNTKKFHLLNWKQVFQPLNKGGLAIRDPTLMNTSLGAKLAWRLITGNTRLVENNTSNQIFQLFQAALFRRSHPLPPWFSDLAPPKKCLPSNQSQTLLGPGEWREN
jgi:hypothetical protein